MKNIHLVLAGESRLSLNRSYKDYAIGTEVSKPYWIYSQYKHHMSVTDTSVRPHNIYITSDEEIKEGDYWVYICPINGLDYGDNNNPIVKNNLPPTWFEKLHDKGNYKKIIITSDQDLIKDGVQAIDDDFLEWFVNNPSCESVKVDKVEDELISPKNPKIRFSALQDPPSFISAESLNNMILTYKYKIIIPKEEAKQRLEKYSERFDNDKSPIGNPDTWGKRIIEEPKQETLEEFIERTIDESFEISLASSKIEKYMKLSAKWQQEQDKKIYSEEEVLNFTQTMIMQYKFGNTNIEQMDLLKETLKQF